ncbi:U-box domain-containing protein [Acrasis kona]|uniref:U-box domain-containing protein n=1 Tax=Acrasis kona TaxID=1008807 RepID=A0AAW2ZNB9_9EUKA
MNHFSVLSAGVDQHKKPVPGSEYIVNNSHVPCNFESSEDFDRIHKYTLVDTKGLYSLILAYDKFGQQLLFVHGGDPDGLPFKRKIPRYTLLDLDVLNGEQITQIAAGHLSIHVLTRQNHLFFIGQNVISRSDWSGQFRQLNIHEWIGNNKTIKKIAASFYSLYVLTDKGALHIQASTETSDPPPRPIYNIKDVIPSGYQFLAVTETNDILKYFNNLHRDVNCNLNFDTSLIKMFKTNNYQTYILTTDSRIFVSADLIAVLSNEEVKVNQARLSNPDYEVWVELHQPQELKQQTIVQISSTHYDLFLLTSNNQVWVRGHNLTGALGLGNNTCQRYFTRLHFDYTLGIPHQVSTYYGGSVISLEQRDTILSKALQETDFVDVEIKTL